ncbi:MAG: hypothetical protein KDA89_01485 [Planctomycetaceae bacterium]|nr:hypothetical protein [Planctomycetaceae bacterium]MCA9047368.1 hypothetical protein [Planctomycetaceae bacterium]
MRRIYALSTLMLLTAAVLVGCNQSANDTTLTNESETSAESTIQFANAKCPIMGGKPKSELTAEYDGQTIGFCCEGCPEKWAALSDEEKAEKLAAASNETTENHDEHNEHEGHDKHAHGGEA